MSKIKVVIWNRDTFEKIVLEKRTRKKMPKKGWIRLKYEVQDG